MRSRIGLGLGPLLAVILWAVPMELSPDSHRLLGILAWVVTWWVSEAVPLAVTSLMAGFLMVLLGVGEPVKVMAPFAHPLIFLFLGGFLIARAMSVHHLDRRVALFLLTRPWVKGSALLSLIIMLLTATGLSLWVSNTATAAMMLPISIGVLGSLGGEKTEENGLIGLAYCASLGGIMTPVGSPPNIIALGMLDRLAGVSLTFFDWMLFAVPVGCLCLGFLIFWLRRFVDVTGSVDVPHLTHELRAMGKLKQEEWGILLVLVLAVFLWLLPGWVSLFAGKQHFLFLWLRQHLPEAMVALGGGILLFVLPGSDGRVLSWKQAVRIDWSALLLFGGGLALGSQLFETGLAQVIGEKLISATGGKSHPWWFLFVCVYFAIFFTETTSNTASANLLVPLVIAAANEIGMDPVIPAVGVAVACSLAFMLPVATPPNAIVYGSERVRLSQMLKIGLVMNLVCGIVLFCGLRIWDWLR